MKTIFITSFNPFISRNILSTDVLKVLANKKDLRIVILVPDYKKEYFQNNFARDNVIVEGVRVQVVDRQDIIFRYLSGFIVNTSRLKIRQREIFSRDKKIFKFIISRTLTYVGFIKFLRELIRFFDKITIRKDKFGKLFEKYNPELIFSTDVFHNDDIHILAGGKIRKIKTVGMVRSWDNITNKGLFRIKPDNLIVHNETIKKEVLDYENINENDIFISGLPQFDSYINKERTPREKFFKSIGLNPTNKTILVAPHGQRFHHTDWQVLKILQKELPENFQFIVRFPPNDTVKFHSFKPDKRFYIEKPGVTFKDGVYSDREVEIEDTITLADDIFYSDVLINYGSTVSIDAVAFKKPVIIIAFDGWDKAPYIKSVRRFLDYDHVRKLVSTGFSKVAHNKGELLRYINLYMKDPSLDQEGRRRLVKEQIWKLDGKSGERIANFIYGQL